MSKRKKHTKNEHFIPRIYFKGFSSNERSVYGYNVEEKKQYPKPFSIADLCQKKYLYEYKDSQNNITSINEIENGLSIIEREFSGFLKQLIKKAFNEENLNTNCFFTSEEKAFWKGFLALQILRYPDYIEKTINQIDNFSNHKLNNSSLRNIALYSSLSLDIILNTEQKSLFSNLMEMLQEMSLSLYVDRTNSLFATDKAISASAVEGTSEIDMIFYPITTSLALVFTNNNHSKVVGNNRMHFFDPENLIIFKKTMATPVKEWIYSRSPLSKEDIKIIEASRNRINNKNNSKQ